MKSIELGISAKQCPLCPATGVRTQAGPGEGREPVVTGKSNVRHIRGILPVVYKQRVMDISTKTASEIMFATGNANKLREVCSNMTAAPSTFWK